MTKSEARAISTILARALRRLIGTEDDGVRPNIYVHLPEIEREELRRTVDRIVADIDEVRAMANAELGGRS